MDSVSTTYCHATNYKLLHMGTIATSGVLQDHPTSQPANGTLQAKIKFVGTAGF